MMSAVFRSSAWNLRAPSQVRGEVMLHSDTPYVFQTLLSTSRRFFSPQEEETLRKAAKLSEPALQGDFKITDLVIDLLTNDAFFPKTNRVSIVSRIGVSNQLMVQSSKTCSPREELMDKGYSCFVSPEGSLMSIGQNMIRVYSNSEKILKNYRSQGKAPQRSIVNISKMNYSSGVCLPIFGTLNFSTGFLFINSSNEQAFEKLTDAKKTLLYYVAHFVGRAIEVAATPSLPYYIEAVKDPAKFHGALFDPKYFDDLKKAKNYKLSVQRTGKTPFIFSHGNLSYLLESFVVKDKPVEIDISDSEISISIDKPMDLNGFRNEATCLGWRVEEEEAKIKISQKLDLTNSSELYSVPMDIHS